MLVDGEGVGHGLHVEVVGADEGEGLLADNFHGTALIDNNQVVDALSWKGILHNLCHNRNFLNGEYFFLTSSKSLTLVKLKEIFRLNSLNRDFQTSLYLFEDVFRKKLSNEAIFL